MSAVPPAIRTLCTGCGVGAPVQKPRCEVCGTGAEARIPFPQIAGGVYAVALRCSFQCRSCNFTSPIDFLDVDGAVECVNCHLRQKFDVGAWAEALPFAHAVGDLAGPTPEGLTPHSHFWIGHDNPYREVGASQTFAELKQSSSEVKDGLVIGRSLMTEAAAGHPVCEKCKLALEVSPAGEGQLQTRCARCNDVAKYSLPRGSKPFHPSLVGVVAADHRTDRTAAKVEAQAGAPTVLKCGACGANLTSIGKSRFVHCTFCHAISRIPRDALVHSPEDMVPAVWWAFFRGPSNARKDLEETNEGDSGLGEAKEAGGIHLAQLMLALLVPAIALAIAWALHGAIH